MSAYIVRCRHCGYESGAEGEAIARGIARVHESLGRRHRCSIKPRDPAPQLELALAGETGGRK